MSHDPTSPLRLVPAVSADPVVEALDDWWVERTRFAAAKPRELLTQLPDLYRMAANEARGEPADVARLRTPMLRLCEGMAHVGVRENDLAAAALQDALQAIESMLPGLATPGLPLFGRKLVGYCHMNLGNVAFNRSDLSAALRSYLHTRDIALMAQLPKLLGSVLGNIGAVYLAAGMWQKQLEFTLESRRICVEAHDFMAATNAEINLAETYRKLRDFAASRQSAEGGIEIARRHGWKNMELCGRMMLAMVDLDEDHPASAIRRLEELEELAREAQRPYLEATRLIELAHAHTALGEREKARGLLATAIARYAPVLSRTVHADAKIALARVEVALGALADATTHATEALDLLSATGLPNAAEIDAREVLADAARARGEWELAFREERARHDAYARHFDAQADLRTRLLAVEHQIDIARAAAAHERVERQRVEELLADLARRLKKADATPRARSPEEITASDLRPLGLTARECEVLLWVARGKTNEEIAIILGCGAETVKSHLKRIYQRLDVTNRAGAAAAALRPVALGVEMTPPRR